MIAYEHLHSVREEKDSVGNPETYDLFARQALHRLTSVKQSGATAIADFTYDALSRRIQLTHGNGVVTTYAYDAASELTTLTTKTPAAATVQSFGYTYDPLGNRATLTTSAGTHTYTYDVRSQLTQVAYPTGAAFASTTWTYDGPGNRTAAQTAGGTTSYTPNVLNQYSLVAGVVYHYDPNGNLTNDGTNTYTYDAENRLLSATTPNGTSSYTYDPLGRRLSKTVAGVTTRFLYDGDQLLAETDASGAIQASYVYGAGIDEPLRLVRGATTSYYHADGLGSVTTLTDASGAVVERASYDVFGAVQLTNASGAIIPTSTVGNRFLFTGREFDGETGLYYYRARYYSPTLGRFLQRDPVGYGPDTNLYRYVGNDPLRWTDPMGLDKQIPFFRAPLAYMDDAGNFIPPSAPPRTTWSRLTNLARDLTDIATGLPTAYERWTSVVSTPADKVLAIGGVALALAPYGKIGELMKIGAIQAGVLWRTAGRIEEFRAALTTLNRIELTGRVVERVTLFQAIGAGSRRVWKEFTSSDQ